MTPLPPPPPSLSPYIKPCCTDVRKAREESENKAMITTMKLVKTNNRRRALD